MIQEGREDPSGTSLGEEIDVGQSIAPRLCPVLESCSLCTTDNQDDAKHAKVLRRLKIALVLCVTLMMFELIGGFVANSIAVLSDAVHMLADASGLAISLFSAWASRRKTRPHNSFGYHRLEVLGALGSLMLLWVVTVALLFEAFQRFMRPQPINGKLMTILAALGVLNNVALLFVLGIENHHHGVGGHSHDHSHDHAHTPLLQAQRDEEAGCHGHDHSHHDHSHHDHPHHDHSHHDHSHHDHDHHDHHHDGLALRAALAHALGDSIQAIGVLIAAGLIWWKQDDPRFLIADPIATCVFSIFVGITSWQVTREIVDTLMERYPRHLDPEKVRAALVAVPGVLNVHDLHCWNITSGKTLLMAHLDSEPSVDTATVLDAAETALQRFGIRHSTLQVEPVTRHSAAFLQEMLVRNGGRTASLEPGHSHDGHAHSHGEHCQGGHAH